MADLASLQATVSGHVQGVFFRASVMKQATGLGLTGYVRNLPDEQELEVHAEGEKERLEKLVEYLKVGPPAAKVEKVVTGWTRYTGHYSQFKIKY
jgi:acylphosphatase